MRLRIAIAACAIAGGIAGAVAIGSCGATPAPADAIPGCDACDEGVPARHDTGALGDVGPYDAGGDPFGMPGADPVAHFTDGWVRVPWAPECTLYQPDGKGDAGASVPVPPLVWQPCSSGRAGCQELRTDWARPKYAITAAWSGMVVSPLVSRVTFLRLFSPYQTEYDVWDSQAGIVGSLRHDGPHNCLEIMPDETGSGVIDLTVAIRSDQHNVQEYRQILTESPNYLVKSTADYTFSPSAVGSSSGIVMSQSSASKNAMTMYFGQANIMAIRDRATNVVDPLRDGGAADTVLLNQPIVGDAVFYSRGDDIAVWRPGIGSRVLITRPGASTHDIATDGSKLAWIESSALDVSGHFTQSALFTSPYTTDAALVSPTMVAKGICPQIFCDMAMSSGYLITSTWTAGDPTISDLVVRLSDNARWILSPIGTGGGAERWNGRAFVLGGELWQPWGTGSGNRGIQRILLSSLGAPFTD